MRKTIPFLFLLIAIIGQVQARLGEDEIQCEDRYGFAKKEFAVTDKMNPLIAGEGAITRTYLYQGWRIRVGFLDGIALREQYWKVTGPGRPLAIADFESNAILDSEKGNATWAPKGAALSINPTKALQNYFATTLMGTTWVRSDGAAVANLDLVKMHLSFDSIAAIQRDQALKQANEAKQRASVPAF